MVRKDDSGNLVVRQWIAVLTFVILLVSTSFSVAMVVYVQPLQERLAKNEQIDVDQGKKIHELDKKCDANDLKFKQIKELLEKIEKKID